jgi:hypothetical protein
MFIIKPLQNGFHNGFPKEFRFVRYTVTVAVDPKRPDLPVVKHQRKPVVPF